MSDPTPMARRAVLTGALGAAVLAASPPARAQGHAAGRAFDLSDFLVGDGATNNDARFDGLLLHMAANPGATYRGRNGDRYLCSFGDRFVPGGVRLMLEGAQFLWAGDLSGSRALILKFGEDVTFDAIRWRFLPGARFERGIEFGHRARGDLVEMVADEQLANGGITNLDGAVRIYGHDSAFGTLKARNLDRPVVVYGPTGGPLLNLVVDHVDVESYVTGLSIRNATGLTVGGHHIRGRSPNGRPDPGHNGILVSSLRDARFGPGHVNDAAEHAYRVAGSDSGEQESDNIGFVGPGSRRSGQCGFKAWSGKNRSDPQPPLRRISVVGGTFTDCGDDGDPGLGFNDFGLMAQDVEDGLFEGVTVSRENMEFCAYHGFYVSGATRSRFLGCASHGAYANSLRVSEFHGNGANSQPTTGLVVDAFTGHDPRRENVYLEFPTSGARDILMTGMQLVGGTDAVRWEGPASGATGPNYIGAVMRGQRDETFDVPASDNIRVVDLMG